MIKRVFSFILFAITSIVAMAQTSKDMTLKFLDIPVDGTEQAMIVSLRNKGFQYHSDSQGNYLTGQFNGENVQVYIHTNHNLVDRIYLSFPYTTSERDIKNTYNLYISQFDKNDKYISILGNETIPIDEDISFEMSVHDKVYQASYRYLNPDIDPEYFSNLLLKQISSYVSEEEAAQYESLMNAYFNSSDKEQFEAQLVEQFEELSNQMETIQDQELAPEQMMLVLSYFQAFEATMTGEVWFTIHKNGTRYHIGMYYDNLANRANGEDF